MSLLEATFADGQWDALADFKLAAPRPGSVPKPPSPLALADQMAKSAPPDNALAAVFNTQEQAISRAAPLQKVSAEDLCTTCRRPKHYGPCLKPLRTRPPGDPHDKAADFNFGMLGDDPTSNDQPATSPHYHAATSSTSSLARAQEGRPADEQAATAFADLFRHQGITSLSNDTPPGQLTGNMRKTAYEPPWGQFTRSEQRGTVNPYEERPQRMSPPLGWGDEGPQRIERAFNQIDNAVDVSGLDGAGVPVGGPLG